jgi:hypothetical protein
MTRRLSRAAVADRPRTQAWAVVARLGIEGLQPDPGEVDFGHGVSFNPAGDMLILRCGDRSDIAIRGARDLMTTMSLGFAAYDAQEHAEAETQPDIHQQVCPGCGTAIRWVRLLRRDGTWHPVNAIPTKAGTLILESDGITVRARSPREAGGAAYETHVGVCDYMNDLIHRTAGPA